MATSRGGRRIADRTKAAATPRGGHEYRQVVKLDDQGIEDALVRSPQVLADEIDGHYSPPAGTMSSRSPRSMTASGGTASRR